MEASEETPKVKSPRMRSGIGVCDPPADVLQMVVECDPILSETEWLRLGRPTWTIVWLCHDSGQSTREAYASTLVPAYLRLCARCICPGKTGGIMAGIAVGNVEKREPCHWRQVGTEEAGIRAVRGVMGSPGRRYLWDYTGSAAVHQQYQCPGSDDVSREPQFSPDAAPEPTPAKKPRQKRQKPASEAEVVPYDKGDRLSDEPHGVDPESPQPRPEPDPCPTPSEKGSSQSEPTQNSSPPTTTERTSAEPPSDPNTSPNL